MEYHHMSTIYSRHFPFLLKVADTTPFHIQAEVTLKTNFFGTRVVCTELLPLIKPQGESDWSPDCSASGKIWAHLALASSTGPLPLLPALTGLHRVSTQPGVPHPEVPPHTAQVLGAVCPPAICTSGSFFSFPS